MNAMLELAKAVYQDHKWDEHDESVFIACCSGGAFNPEIYDDQAWDVLAWLLKQDVYIDHAGANVMLDATTDHMFSHDGTAACIRKAIVQAALRCVEGK